MRFAEEITGHRVSIHERRRAFYEHEQTLKMGVAVGGFCQGCGKRFELARQFLGLLNQFVFRSIQISDQRDMRFKDWTIELTRKITNGAAKYLGTLCRKA